MHRKKQLDGLGVSAFCESLAMMMRSGIPTSEAMELLAENGEKGRGPLEDALMQMRESLLDGDSLSKAMEQTEIFPDYALEMVRAGEKSGRLEDVLFRLSEYYADSAQINEQVQSAVTYPAAMIALIIAVLTIMLTMVLPAFSRVYDNLAGGMAESGYGYIRWSYIFCWIALGLMVLIALLMIIGAIAWKTGHRGPVEAVARRLPAFRRIFDEMGLFRFTSAVVLFLTGGEVQDEAVSRSIPMTMNPAVENTLREVLHRMDQGRSLAQAAYDVHLFEPVYGRMLLAGERSGNLEDVLSHLSAILRAGYSRRIEKLTGFIDPLLSGILIITVGLSLLSMMLPLIGMMNAVG